MKKNHLSLEIYGSGMVIAATLFLTGYLRISYAINELRITDPYTGHFSSVGLLYLAFSSLILVGLIVYALIQNRK